MLNKNYLQFQVVTQCEVVLAFGHGLLGTHTVRIRFYICLQYHVVLLFHFVSEILLE